jgi:hypothetical protein
VPNPQPARLRKTGVVIAVVATNVLPIAGVLFLGWKVFHIALLYWFEVFIIGVTEVLANLVYNPDPEATKRIRADIVQSKSNIVRAVHWGRLIVFQIFRRIIGVLVTAFIFSIMAAMYGLAIMQYLSEERLPPPPESIIEHTMIAVPVAILIYIFTTNLKWPAFVILLRFAASGIVHLVTWWQDGGKLWQAQSSSFLNHIIFLHFASFAVILLINLLGSPEPAILAILIGKATVELFIARHDLADA